jgi:hypothetical protein
MIGFEDLFCGFYGDEYTTHCDIILKEIVNHARRHGASFTLMVRNNFSSQAPKLIDVSLARWLMKKLPSPKMQLLDYWILHGETHISLAKQWLL